MNFVLDAEAEAQVERVRKYFVDIEDLTLLVLKGHLLVEESLNSLIALGSEEPHHLEKERIPFLLKAKIAQALWGKRFYRPIWLLVVTLNTIRNDMAHHLESRKLRDHVLDFIAKRKKHFSVLIDQNKSPKTPKDTLEELKRSLSILLGQLVAAEVVARAVKDDAHSVGPADRRKRASSAHGTHAALPRRGG
jgi:hypothetical protein